MLTLFDSPQELESLLEQTRRSPGEFELPLDLLRHVGRCCAILSHLDGEPDTQMHAAVAALHISKLLEATDAGGDAVAGTLARTEPKVTVRPSGIVIVQS